MPTSSYKKEIIEAFQNQLGIKIENFNSSMFDVINTRVEIEEMKRKEELLRKEDERKKEQEKRDRERKEQERLAQEKRERERKELEERRERERAQAQEAERERRLDRQRQLDHDKLLLLEQQVRQKTSKKEDTDIAEDDTDITPSVKSTHHSYTVDDEDYSYYSSSTSDGCLDKITRFYKKVLYVIIGILALVGAFVVISIIVDYYSSSDSSSIKKVAPSPVQKEEKQVVENNVEPIVAYEDIVDEEDSEGDDCFVEYYLVSKELFTEDNLRGLTPEGLRYLRNAIFARHGKIFKSPELSEHFSQFDWYTPIKEDVGLDDLNEFEKANLKLIMECEKKYK